MQPHIIKRGIPNITLLIVVYFTLMIVLLSCHSEKSVELEISPMELELSNIEEISYLQLTATAEWSVAVAADWCSVTPQSGRGSGTLTLIAQPNMGDKERVATLKVSSGGISREVKVVQPASTLLVEPDELNFTKEGGVLSIEIEANCEWEVLDPKDGWITFDPKKGEGSATLSITLEENSGSSRNGHITIRYGVRNKTISIKQQRATGSELYQPQLKTPSAGESGISRLPAFRWSSARKKGLVEEEVFYRLEIGEESGVWSEQIELTDTLLYWVDNLKADQLYYWQVTATDPFDQSTTTSTVGSFRTGERSSYRDGEYQIYQQHSKGSSPSNLIFMGDGYLAEDFIEGGKFDNEIDEGIEAFFALEPYRSYRPYFSIYKVAAYSHEEGITESDKNIYLDTRFKAKFKGGSAIDVDDQSVFEMAKTIPGIDDETLKSSVIILALNRDRYAGTCYMYADGKAIALCPVSRSTEPGSSYGNIVAHEAGGHGYAKLADEYITNEGVGKRVVEEEIESYRQFVEYGFYSNISLTGSRESVKWSHFFGIPNYEEVSLYEGGLYYSYGVWRPENSSCMVDNRLYFNGPSREAMVKRILSIAGESYSFQRFLDGDTPALHPSIEQKEGAKGKFIPLAPPVLIE